MLKAAGGLFSAHPETAKFTANLIDNTDVINTLRTPIPKLPQDIQLQREDKRV